LSLEIAVRDRLGDPVVEGFDFAVRFGEPEPSTLIGRRLLQTRVLTCASPSYLKERGRPNQPIELANGRHECILFRDPSTGHPFPWEFHRRKKIIKVPVNSRLVLNDPATQLGLCAGGYGVAQILELGAESMLASGVLENLFPDWSDELFPLYALHPSKNLPAGQSPRFFGLHHRGGRIRCLSASFGRPFISNPDLVERFANDWPLNDGASPKLWNSFDTVGYTDFPTYRELQR
jgi:DNA-binding transcriptional LysR family regulator